MKASDLIKVCKELKTQLEPGKRKFVADMARLLYSKKTISPAQHAYLQSCYDLAVARAYNLKEDFKPDKEHFRQLNIKRRQKAY